MEKQMEMPKTQQEIIAEKKKKLIDSVDLMLDWQKAEKIRNFILPILDSFSLEELDYSIKFVKYLDNKTQLRGPLAAMAKEAIAENEKELQGIEKNIRPVIAQIFKKI